MHVRTRQCPRRLTVTVSASEEETHYVQSTSVALGSDFSRISRARRGTREKRKKKTKEKAQRAAPRRDTPFRSLKGRSYCSLCRVPGNGRKSKAHPFASVKTLN
ncbi:hypothetical protein PUN28_005910 [Cardiocondyla obscurior]|uniref:Uncharacterized protein n=1 Tax=Cardiocondyla obscurior TaxID=286306 RepID=A0AAW2G662_9HYME